MSDHSAAPTYMKWTHTVETVAEVEQAGAKGQWRIGDALAADLADFVDAERYRPNRKLSGNKGSHALHKFRVPPEAFKDCSEQLAKRG
jgi:hypothetical protein